MKKMSIGMKVHIPLIAIMSPFVKTTFKSMDRPHAKVHNDIKYIVEGIKTDKLSRKEIIELFDYLNEIVETKA